jgi:hypothetical protein
MITQEKFSTFPISFSGGEKLDFSAVLAYQLFISGSSASADACSVYTF